MWTRTDTLERRKKDVFVAVKIRRSARVQVMKQKFGGQAEGVLKPNNDQYH